MKSTDICWNSGVVAYWNMDDIDETRSLNNQSASLREDLAQIHYEDGILLDIGWYPSIDPNGKFQVCVIIDSDWQSPVFRAAAKDILELREQIAIAISIIKQVTHL